MKPSVRHWLFLLMISFSLASQPSADELERRLPSATDQEKVTLLIQISHERARNAPQAGFLGLGEALELTRKLKDPKREVDVLNDLAALKVSVGDYQDALHSLELCASIADRIGYRQGLSKCISEQALLQERLGNFDAALETNFKALRINELIGDDLQTAECLKNLGVTHFRLNQLDQAAQVWERALDIFNKLNNNFGSAAVLNNLGVLCKSRKDYAKAAEFYNRALELRIPIDDQKGISEVYQNLAVMYYEQKDYPRSIQYNEKALKIREKLGDKYAIAMSAHNIALVYSAMGQFDKGQPHLDKAISISEEIKAGNILSNCYLLESDYATARGDFKKALDWYEKFYHEKDALFSKDMIEKIASMEIRYDLERKQREIEILRKDQIIRRSATRLYLVALVGLSILVALMYSFYRIKNRSQREIARKNRDLEILDSIVRSINRHTDLRDLAQDLLNKGSFLIPRADRISLYLLNLDRSEFHVEASLGFQREEASLLGSLSLPYQETIDRYTSAGQALGSGVFAVPPSRRAEGPGVLPGAAPPSAVIAMTLLVDEGVEGLLVLENLGDPEAFGPSDISHLITFREHAVSAIAKARTFLRLQNEIRSREEINLELQDLSELKSQLIEIAAHDLRGPLAGIVGASELLEGETDPGQIGVLSKLINQEGKDMSELIDRFLNLEAIESGGLVPEPSCFPLPPVIEKVMSRYRQPSKEKDIRLEFHPDDGREPVFADARLAEEVVDNLVSNAIKFSPPGRTVTLRTERSGDMMVLSVEDEGPGFTEEDRRNLFRRFTKLSATPTAGEKSIGLGLFISKNMVEAMGGSIRVTGEPGRGSTFHVGLPLGGKKVVPGSA